MNVKLNAGNKRNMNKMAQRRNNPTKLYNGAIREKLILSKPDLSIMREQILKIILNNNYF